MPDGSRTWEETASARKGGDGIGLEIIAKLATVLEVERAELLRVAPGMRRVVSREGARLHNMLRGPNFLRDRQK
jgi:hypothetical protein